MGLVDFAIRRRVTIAMATVAITLLGIHFALAAQGEPAAGPLLSDADDPHRAAGRRADRNREPDLAPHRGSRGRGAQRALGALGVALRPVRRDHRVHLGHGHGLRGHRSARAPRPAVAAHRSHPPAAAALRSVQRAGHARRVRRRNRLVKDRGRQPRRSAQIPAALRRRSHQAGDRIRRRLGGRQGQRRLRRRGADLRRPAAPRAAQAVDRTGRASASAPKT